MDQKLTASDRAVAAAKEQLREKDRRAIAEGQVSVREMNRRNFIASDVIHHYRVTKVGQLR